MMKGKVKKFFSMAALVAAALLVDFFFGLLSLPVSAMDLLFLPFSVALLAGGVYALLKKGYRPVRETGEAGSPKRRLLSVMLFPLLIVAGVYLFWEGIQNPSGLFSGVRIGQTHGYTVVALSLVCISYSTYYLCILIADRFRRIRRHH